MRRMSSEEEQEVFEITDFTTASDWERFIARIEEIIHEWKLPLHRPRKPLKKGDLTEGTWIEKREQLMFASFQFEAAYHHLKTENIDAEIENSPESEDEEDGEQTPYCLADMLSRENDFPPKAHCLVRWYGLRDFVVIHPAKMSDAIMTEDRTKMLLSSALIAINNTNCQVPIFFQLQQMMQKYFLGVCEGGGVRINFDMVHLHRPFPQYSHLSGLLSLFKSKLSSSAIDVPSVGVSIRFTYVLQDWSPCSWPQPPPDIDELGEDISPTDLSRLPCGALEDPILEFHLSTTWPFLSEDVVIDNEVHSDLNAVAAPIWSVRMRTADNPSCSMAEYLKEFAVLSQGYESVNQLIGNAVDEDDISECQHVTEVLDKLAHPQPPVPLPRLSLSMMQSQLRPPNSQEPPPISEEVLIKILQFIFPDAAPTPEEQEHEEYKDTVGSVSDLQNTTSFSKVQEHMRSFKSAPPGSLTWRLALAMCQVNHSYGGLPAVAQLWQDFLLEMRHRWENNYTLPCLEPGHPNMTHCLLHQKLQMLNCCIQRKKAREWQHLSRSRDSIENSNKRTTSRSSENGSASVLGSESDDEEFFECPENSSSSSSLENSKTKKDAPEGRLRQHGDLKLLNSDEPLYIPVTQEPAPVTEDLLEQQAEVLVQLGTNPEGAALRARMQSACLMSDMEAFKAANPNAILEDFVRWYSPRDLIEEEVVDEATGKRVIKTRLSARMLLPENMWLEAWENARPIPARRQKRLFDDTKEAEKVLHFLASAKTADVVSYLMPILVHCAILQLADEAEECPKSLITKLEECAVKTAKVTRSADPKYEGVLRCLYQAEVIVAQLQSARKKFCNELDDVHRRDSLSRQRAPAGDATPNSGSDTFAPAERKSSCQRSSDLSKLVASEQKEVLRFVLDLLDHSEIEVPKAGRGVVGKRIRNLFAEAQRASHLIIDEIPLSSSSSQGESESHHSTVPEFPPPSGKEFILRTTMARPSVHGTPSPQRMYCVLTKDEFRLAGAFSHDTTFL